MGGTAARWSAAGRRPRTATPITRIFAALGHGDGARVTEIAERLGSTKQTVGPLVDELVARGYLHRRRDPADARAKIVDFTPGGTTAVEAARRSAENIDRPWADRIGDRRLDECRAALWELVNEPADPTGGS
ncbi:MarR family winged helix-turn-helix transcriptional regulator [Streptomyces sp. NPDC058377]|uniref:MarR family winged helix-turn-helix transcriptional regulator n=1 Tax=Streptomyces sp. NPDC058377 TaxID=3346468 RepID=UPI003668B76C